MKNQTARQQSQQPAPKIPKLPAVGLEQTVQEFVPAADEVARRACFSYVSRRPKPKHQVQHWLRAEAEILGERGRTHAHGVHKPT